MTTPRTLPALRSAVARVLVARGEAGDALRVTLETMRGTWRVETRAPVGSHPLAILTYGATAESACARLWSEVVERVDAEDDAALATMREAIAAATRARAALDAARELGDE